MFPVRWFAKFGLSALALLLACGLATAWFGNTPQLPSTTTRDGTLITLNRYVTEPIPDVVLLGSSLTFRLKEEYFATPALRNLAVAGGSPVTGLEIVESQARLPKLILVETNALSRAADPAVVYLEHLTGSLFLENEDEVRRYTVVFNHLRAEALGTGQSIDLIAQVAKGFS